MKLSAEARTNLLNLSLTQLKAWVVQLNEPAFRAQQLVEWIYKKQCNDFSQMHNLSRIFRQKLQDQAEVTLPSLLSEHISKDGTCKWLLKLDTNIAIETVYIPFYGQDGEISRATLCVSSQAGCALNCSFCATGKAGFNRNLSLAEIIGQVWFTQYRLNQLNLKKITNVVMMGMGEPLLNYQPVVDAMDIMLSDSAFNLSKYKVTLSTSGVVPAMEKLKGDSPVSLAVSLHAANNALRNELVPLNKKYPLEVLLEVCKNYFPPESKRVTTFEYVMLKKVNDQKTDAMQLISILKSVPCKINLIPFNPFPQTFYECSDLDTILNFQKILVQAGFNTRIRTTRGEETQSACGQLAGNFLDRTGRKKRLQSKLVRYND